MSDPTPDGCQPQDCCGDPSAHLTNDPRFSGLPASVVENAKQAKCSRCKETVVESKAMTGTVMVNYYVPAVGVRQRTILCGLCGLLLRELLHPELADNPTYQAVKAELRARFS